MRRVFDERRDMAMAETAYADAALQCSVQGCPNRWSSDFGRRLCSAHAAADPADWPAVARHQADAQTDRAYRRQSLRPPSPAPLSVEDKRAALQRLRSLFLQPVDARAWARRLRDREAAGEALSQVQRQAWRYALREVEA